MSEINFSSLEMEKWYYFWICLF